MVGLSRGTIAVMTRKTYRYVPDGETDRVLAQVEATLRDLGAGTAPAPKVRAKAAVPPEHLTVAEAADLLRRSTRTIHRYVASGRLVATQATHGGHLLIARTEIEKLRTRKR